MDAARLSLVGNFEGGEAHVALRGTARVRPGCVLDTGPSSLQFGIVRPGGGGTVFATLDNPAGHACLVVSDEEGELVVRRDGVELPSVSPKGSQLWWYEVSTQSVKFSLPLAPGVYEVEYESGCTGQE